jgi:hypothetical protein
MKRLRRDTPTPWYEPLSSPRVAKFQCRKCHAFLTNCLTLLFDSKQLSQEEHTSVISVGYYWLNDHNEEFPRHYVVSLQDAILINYHKDTNRLIGCCGPSGNAGRNRVCACGYEVGTERSDCMWSQGVYLDPERIIAVTQDA